MTAAKALGERVADIAERLVRVTLDRPATLGVMRLICVDGPAGSGKTTLGEGLVRAAAAHCPVQLVHMDDVYEGWSGLETALPRVARDLVEPLAAGRTGRYQRYDWEAERLADWRSVDPTGLLVIEGVGSGASAYGERITTLVWVEAPRDQRIARGIARDGRQVLPLWTAWMKDEEALFARERSRERADVVVDGTGDGDRTVVLTSGAG